jgi:SAM-dependent methyltransferase
MKKKIKHFLRKTNLLSLVDKMLFAYDVFKNRKANRLFLAEHPDFVAPPNHLAYDAYNHTNWQLYFETGLRNASLISELINKYLLVSSVRILEWGCGPARVIRHLSNIYEINKVELFGSDYNEETIKWCNANINNTQFYLSHGEPPLSFEAETFDCVYAYSVFTHLSERMHFDWVKELFRVLKPNGILIFSTHGDYSSFKVLFPFEKKQYENGNLVIRGGIEEGKKHYASYHPPKFIKNKLLKDMIVLEHFKGPLFDHLEQDVWVVRK